MFPRLGFPVKIEGGVGGILARIRKRFTNQAGEDGDLTSVQGVIRVLLMIVFLGFLGAILGWIVFTFVQYSGISKEASSQVIGYYNATAGTVAKYSGLLVLAIIIAIVIGIVLRYLVPYVRGMMGGK